MVLKEPLTISIFARLDFELLLRLEGGILYLQDNWSLCNELFIYLQSEFSRTNSVTSAQFEQKPKVENIGKVQLPVTHMGLLSSNRLLLTAALLMTASQS